MKLHARAPGVALSLAAAGVSYAVSRVVPGASALLVAIVLGVVLTNVVRLPAAVTPGTDFAAKRLLRAGIVVLGLQVAVGDILALGAPMLLVVVCIVAGGIGGTWVLGRWLGVPPGLRLLVACGFSICGAAAVAATAGVIDPDDEAEQDTITAVALVVMCGTLMIAALPALAHLMGMDPHTTGMWAGGAVHEIAQVVAVGGIVGGGALTVAVIVKLARVLMLAPVMAVVSVRRRRAATSAGSAGVRPPVVPLFVAGFVAMVVLRSVVTLPAPILTAASTVQTALLASAMFALGCGVRVAALARVGPRPFALAGLSTVWVAGIALLGVTVCA